MTIIPQVREPASTLLASESSHGNYLLRKGATTKCSNEPSVPITERLGLAFMYLLVCNPSNHQAGWTVEPLNITSDLVPSNTQNVTYFLFLGKYLIVLFRKDCRNEVLHIYAKNYSSSSKGPVCTLTISLGLD